MFLLQPKPTFEAEVSIATPGGAEGKIKFMFKHKGRKALKEFFETLSDGEVSRPDHEALLDLVGGWKGVDEPFSPEALETLLDNYPAAAQAIFQAYHKLLLEGRAKN